MPIHNIGFRNGLSLAVFFTASRIFLTLPRTAVDISGTAGCLLMLLSGLASSAPALVISGLLTCCRGQSLLQFTDQVFGQILGTLVNFVYFLFFYYGAFVTLRQFSENIVGAAYPRTPLPVIILCFVAAGSYASARGVEPLARVAWLCAPFTLAGLATLLIGGLLTYTTINAFTPIWGYGVGPTLLGSGLGASRFEGGLLLAVLARHFRTTREATRSVWFTLAVSWLAFLAVQFVYMQVFPYPSSARISFPLFAVSRTIITGRWFQRVESIFFIMWVIAGFLRVATGLYASSLILAHLMRMEDYRLLLPALGVAAYHLAQLPRNLPAAEGWDAHVMLAFGWIVVLVLPLITLIVSRFRKEKPAVAG